MVLGDGVQQLLFGIIRKKLDAVERDGEADKSAADSSHQELIEEDSSVTWLAPPIYGSPLTMMVAPAWQGSQTLIREIDGNSVGIKEETERSKEFAMEKKRVLEEEKEQFQKAAYTILDMLSNRVLDGAVLVYTLLSWYCI
ncbi:hypothetical protein F2Q69_00043760 [Brassica cretica]|uniref:Uncharacterized protein n=1 Tax=Brassica cretica TaxID=69181 RepID=A0A8S9NTZ8_BRACR|nr:hypothetical protein F2Q69_00043760 [Brassica cretica]